MISKIVIDEWILSNFDGGDGPIFKLLMIISDIKQVEKAYKINLTND